MKNSLFEIQETLMRQIKRIDDETLHGKDLEQEIARSNAISNTANTYIKTININIRVKELADKFKVTKKSINEEIGL